jgi:hypothetical protein
MQEQLGLELEPTSVLDSHLGFMSGRTDPPQVRWIQPRRVEENK